MCPAHDAPTPVEEEPQSTPAVAASLKLFVASRRTAYISVWILNSLKAAFKRKMEIQTYLTHALVADDMSHRGSIAVVVDVLRASTSICTALHRGAREVIPALEIEDAMRIAGKLDKEVRLLAGERNCVKPDGFDLGNSPLEYTNEILNGKALVFTSTNGAQAIARTRFAAHRLVGGFANLSVLIDYIVAHRNGEDGPRRIELVCAGTDGNFSFEDTFGVGAIAGELRKRLGDVAICDATRAALELYTLHKSRLTDFVMSTSHAQRLHDLGYGDDVAYCLTADTAPVVPIFENSTLKAALSASMEHPSA